MKRYFFLIPMLLFLLHGSYFFDYVVDDSAITLCYARNIAAGYGPSLSPMGELVEGYSHPLWLLLLVPFALVGVSLFSTIKLLGTLTALLAIYYLTNLPTIQEERPFESSDIIAPSLLALNTGFVMWSLSGLENGLTCLLTVLLLQGLAMNDWKRTTASALLLSLTRPEGVLLALLALFFLREERVKSLFLLLSGLGLFLLMRFYHFSQLLPNTYYAKKGLGLWGLLSPVSPGWSYLFHSFSESGTWPLVLLIPFGLYGCNRNSRTRLALLLLATLIFPLWAGGDWMPCGRFLTTSFILIFLLAQMGLQYLMKSFFQKFLQPVLLVLFLSWPIVSSFQSTAHYSKNPTVHTKYRVARGAFFEELRKRLHLSQASVLEPDVGGVAWAGPNLEVIDLSGLCDLALARHRFRPRFFLPYILEEKKPTFVHLHGAWTALCGLPSKQGFITDYIPLSGKELNWFRRDTIEFRPQKVAEPLCRWDNGLELMTINRPLPSQLELIFRKNSKKQIETKLIVECAKEGWREDSSLLFDNLPPLRWSVDKWYRSTHLIPPDLDGPIVIELTGKDGGRRGLPCPKCTIDDIRQLAVSLPGDVSKVLSTANRVASLDDKIARDGFIKNLLRFKNSNPTPPAIWWETLFLSLPPSLGHCSELHELRHSLAKKLFEKGRALLHKKKPDSEFQAFLCYAKAAKIAPKQSALTSAREFVRSLRLKNATNSLLAPLLKRVKEEPQSSAAWKDLGDLYLNEHLWPEAISAYEESAAWATPAELGNIFLRIAACKYKSADLWGARRAGRQAIESGADLPPSLKEVLGIKPLTTTKGRQ